METREREKWKEGVDKGGQKCAPLSAHCIEAPVVRKGIGIYGTATLIRVKPTLLDLFGVVK